MRLLVDVAGPVQHDFDTQPLCEVPVRLSLHNCLQSPASLCVETGSHQRLQQQHSGKSSTCRKRETAVVPSVKFLHCGHACFAGDRRVVSQQIQ